MGLFKRGYEASRAEKERQDKARENMGRKLWRFFLKDDGDEADLRFLNGEPVNFYEHNIKRGENRFEQFTCTAENCPFCAEGDKPTYKGAYLVVDRREFEYTDRNGKKQKGRNQVRLFVQGMKVVSQLDRLHSRYGITNRDVTMVRLGRGTQTTYTIERGEEEKMTTKEIKDLLPDKLRDDFDGSQDSLMNIIEEQLLMNTKDYDPSANENEEEEESEETTSGRSRLIGLEDEDESAEEPTPPKKTGGLKSKFHKAQNSVKPTAKAMLRAKKFGEEIPF